MALGACRRDALNLAQKCAVGIVHRQLAFSWKECLFS